MPDEFDGRPRTDRNLLDETLRARLEVAPGVLDELGFYATRRLSTGHWLALEPMTFGRVRLGASALTGDTALEAFRLGYVDVWEFATKADGLEQLRTWSGEGEPTGWIRHPATARRRQTNGYCLVRETELSAEMIAGLRAQVADGAGHECLEWLGEKTGQCVLCDRVPL